MLGPGEKTRLNPRAGSNTGKAVYGAGSAYSLTAVSALVNLGTTAPSITLTESGIYIIFARLRLDYNAATFAAVRNVSAKLRRINNTAADITNASAGLKTGVITTLTYTAGDINIPPVMYQTDQINDNIQIFASIDVVPTAGSLDVVEAEIVAIKLS